MSGINFEAMPAYALWVGLHLLLTLMLALNASRHRILLAQKKCDEAQLNQAIRAHGNNIEYVPFALLGIGVLVVFSYSAVWIHALSALLFLARLCHAHGIHQNTVLPKTRVIGNLLTWIIFLATALLLIYTALAQ